MNKYIKKCPQCRNKLERVPDSKWMNSDQWEASKAGDWFCKTCPDNGRSSSGLCYWWNREIEEYEKQECDSITRV
jgi:hypothetical protein